MSFLAQKWKRIPVALMVACSVAISGCASTGSSMLGKGVRPDPRLTQGNDAKFFSQSGLEACMMGAAAGAVVGLLAGGKNKGTAAVVGAVAACGVAMGANYYLDVRRGQYQNTSDQLKAMGDDIKTDTQKVQARSNSIKAVMADDKRKLERLQSDITAKTGDQAAAKRELAQIDANIGVIKKDLSNMKNVADQYRQAGAQTRGSAKETRECSSSSPRWRPRLPNSTRKRTATSPFVAPLISGAEGMTRMSIRILRAVPVLTLVVLAGCATTAADCDPSNRNAGFLTKMNCDAGGGYGKHVAQREDEVRAAQVENAQARQVLADLEAQREAIGKSVAEKTKARDALSASVKKLLDQARPSHSTVRSSSGSWPSPKRR